MSNNSGNISTIIKWISMIFAGWMIGFLAAHGLHLNIDQALLSEVIGAVIWMFLGYWDAKDSNTFGFLGNAPEDDTADDENAC